MRFRRKKIAQTENFITFLRDKFDYRNIQPVNDTGSGRFGTNQFFTAETPEGQKIFIKSTADAYLVKAEYYAYKHLHELDPVHFVDAVGYHFRRPYAFCATCFTAGVMLSDFLASTEVTDEDRIIILKNIYDIFCTLRKSDIVHRDLYLNQMLYDKEQGIVKLIDFQNSASKSNYQEAAYRRFFDLADFRFKYKRFIWDDANDLLLLIDAVGCPEHFAPQFQEMRRDIEAHVGKHCIHYQLPGFFKLYASLLMFTLKKYMYKGHKRDIYENRVRQCKYILNEAKQLRNKQN